MRTSHTHPLYIAKVQPRIDHGLIGITFAPGKKQVDSLTGQWDRDLALDLDVIAAWNAAAVVTLVEPHELHSLQVPDLGQGIANRHMGWIHSPIRDQGIPDAAFEAQWATVGPALRGMLRDGANVVIHCKGGLGRAGTIAARLMIELGVHPKEAVERVRSARPGAIENARQLDYVLGQTAQSDSMPDTGPEATRDRATGALLGLAVGDALGATNEFRKRGSFPRLTGIIGGGPFRLRPGDWTDDTAMALALATSLNECRGFDAYDLMQRFVEWLENGEYACTGTCVDVGSTVYQALNHFRTYKDPIAGKADPFSAGNGSLMRLAPVAIRYWQDRKVLHDVASGQSRTTHGAAEAVDACVAFAEVLADAIAGRPRHEVMRRRKEPFSDNIARIMAGSWRGKHRDEVSSSGYVVHSLEAALWCVGRTGSFAEAVLLAANLGDDSDTVAAITGQLAGALYGKAGIPAEWLKRLAWSDLIESLALELTTPAGWYPG